MKDYEITFITKEDLKDTPVKESLADFSGKILSTGIAQEKPFAYKIKKENRGFYTTVVFSLGPEKISSFQKKMALRDDVLRFLILSFKEVKQPKEKVALGEIIKKVEEIPVDSEENITKEVPKKEKKTEKVKTEPKVMPKVPRVKEEAVSDEERLKALDKKLDELLKE